MLLGGQSPNNKQTEQPEQKVVLTVVPQQKTFVGKDMAKLDDKVNEFLEANVAATPDNAYSMKKEYVLRGKQLFKEDGEFIVVFDLLKVTEINE